MISLTGDELSELRKLLFRVRKAASDIEKLPNQTLYREGYREQVVNIAQQVNQFVTKHSEFQQDYKDIPQDVGQRHPLSFETDLKILRAFMDVVEDSIISETPSQPPSQFIILPGQAFTASKIIETILQQATSNIKIVDNFMSEESVRVLETANSQRNLSIITKSIDPNFIAAIKVMQKGWKGNLEVKESTSFHDRYLILDDSSIWMCGPSLDYLGVKKPGVIIKIEETQIIREIVGLFNSAWQQSAKII